MHKLTQFQIVKEKVKGEYEGNEKTGKVVVFSHGFGVGRDQRGKFTELGGVLRDDFLIVRFDFNSFSKDRKSMYVSSLPIQAQMFDAVIDYVNKKFKPKDLYVVAYSMGCVVVGLANFKTSVNKIVLNVGPVYPIYKRFKEYFSKRVGTELNERGESKIQRSDGSYTYVGKDFWAGLKTLLPLNLYKKLLLKSKIYFIRAKDDQMVVDSTQEIIQNNKFNYFELSGDHDFSGNAREKWVDLVSKMLNN